jgi:hypothetical protein
MNRAEHNERVAEAPSSEHAVKERGQQSRSPWAGRSSISSGPCGRADCTAIAIIIRIACH